MCVIAAKPAGLSMPDTETIANMWHSNHDGAGIMYNHDGKVHIEKGFMTLGAFMDALDRISETVDLKQAAVVMHFRITTHGGTNPENTHPFPISDSIPVLKKTRLTTRIGVAHNGIIHNIPRSKDISDTMEYIASQLAPLYKALPKFYENKNAMLLVKNAIDSKMAFLTSDGGIYTIGDFVEDNGIKYSNRSYEGWWSSYRNYTTGEWDATTGKWKDYDRFTYPYASTDSYVDDFITTHFLMPLTDVYGAYYITEDGEMIEDTNYEIFMDAYGDLWWLDADDALAYRESGVIGAYDKNGMALRFQPQLAVEVDCYDFYEVAGLDPHDDGQVKG